MSKKPRGLEVEQDLAFQRREWSVQRIGWWALSVFVVAAFLGLFGSGPLSRGHAGAQGAPLSADYERFVRMGSLTRISVHFAPPPGAAPREVRVNRDFFERIRIDRLTPEPARIVVGPEQVTLVFDVRDGDGAATLIMDLEPLRVGRQRVAISTASVPALTFTQFAYF